MENEDTAAAVDLEFRARKGEEGAREVTVKTVLGICNHGKCRMGNA